MFLKICVHISKVIFRLILTLLFYWNRSISQEFNNLEKVILLSKRTGQLFQELCIQESSHWEVFLKTGAHISQLYPDWCEHSYFIGTGLFPRGQQIWKVMLLSKRTGHLFQEVCIYFLLFVSKISQTIKEQPGSPVVDILGEQLHFPRHENIEE